MDGASERVKEEFLILWSQIGTAKFSKTRALPYAFTEQGVYMLATVINSTTAIAVRFNSFEIYDYIHQTINLLNLQY